MYIYVSNLHHHYLKKRKTLFLTQVNLHKLITQTMYTHSKHNLLFQMTNFLGNSLLQFEKNNDTKFVVILIPDYQHIISTGSHH